jgi:Signal transduction histidine kinase
MTRMYPPISTASRKEAVNNAIKHGDAKNLLITLSARKEYGQLTIENDGLNMSQSKQSSGMGLRIMNYRAHMIGGTLRVDSNSSRGVIVTCSFPLPLKLGKIENFHC